MNWQHEVESIHAQEEIEQAVGKISSMMMYLFILFILIVSVTAITQIDQSESLSFVIGLTIVLGVYTIRHLDSEDTIKLFNCYRDRWLEQKVSMTEASDALIAELIEKDSKCDKIIEQAREWKGRATDAEMAVVEQDAYIVEIKKYADLRRNPLHGIKRWTVDTLKADFIGRGLDPSIIYNQSDLDREYRNGHRKAFNGGAKLYFDHYRAEEYEPDDSLGGDTISDQEDTDIQG